MEKVKILGVRETSFKTDDGTQVNGVSIFYAYPATNVKGVATDKFFLNGEKRDAIEKRLGGGVEKLVNSDVGLEYNRYGKVDNIHVG